MVEMLFNDGWHLAFTVLAAVELVVVPWLIYRYRKQLLDWSYFRPWGTLFLLASACGGFVIMGAPYVFMANAVLSSGEVVLFTGPVTAKWISQGKSKSYIVQVADRLQGVPVEVLASSQEYESVSVGGQFSRCMSVGRFKLPYLWRYGSKPSCEAQ